jgi:hypothetical protein
MKHPRRDWFLLSAGGLLASVAPLCAVVAVNWNDYVTTTADAVKLGTGGLIAAILLALKVSARIKIPSSTTVVLITLVLSILLKPILQDLTLLCTAYLSGEVINVIFFKRRIEAAKAYIDANRQMDATEERQRRLFEEYVGNGRT